MLPWFFIFCDISHCCLCIWSSSHLLKSLVTTFVRKITSVNFARESVAVSDLLWAQLLHLLAPICGRIIQLVCLLWILEHASLSCESLFLFSREGAKAQLCILSLVRRFGCFYLCAHWPPVLTASNMRSVQRELARGCGGSVGKAFHWFLDWPLDWICSVLIDSRICTPLISPESPVWPLPTSLDPILEFKVQFSGWGRKDGSPTGSIAYTWRIQVLTHTRPSSCRRNHGQRKTSVVSKLCHLWGGVTWKKFRLALLHTPMHTNKIFCSSGVLEILWKPSPPCRLFSVDDSKPLCSRDSWTMAKRGWSQYMDHCRVCSWGWGPWAYYQL